MTLRTFIQTNQSSFMLAKIPITWQDTLLTGNAIMTFVIVIFTNVRKHSAMLRKDYNALVDICSLYIIAKVGGDVKLMFTIWRL